MVILIGEAAPIAAVSVGQELIAPEFPCCLGTAQGVYHYFFKVPEHLYPVLNRALSFFSSDYLYAPVPKLII